MFSLSRKPLFVFGAAFILLALTTAVARSTPGRPEPSPDGSVSGTITAQLGTHFTYQGKLNDGGSPANGEYDFQFILYDAAVGGSQSGPILNVENIQVTDGFFTTSLDFGGVFTGSALWLDIGVRAGNSGGAYTILSPRQPLDPVPYALGLLPGAAIDNPTGHGLVIANAAISGVRVENAASGLYIQNANQDAIHIDSAGLEGVDINDAAADGFEVDIAGEDGLHVGESGDDGVHVVEAGSDGVRVGSAGTDGLHVGESGDDGVHVADAGSDGVEVGTTAGAGVRIVDAGGHGVNVEGADLNGIRVGTAGSNGVRITNASLNGLSVGDATESGVNIDHADGDGIFICAVGAETTCTPSGFIHGVEIGTTEHSGVFVDSAGGSGFVVDSAMVSGVFVASAGVSGLQVNSALVGLDVTGSDLGGFFNGGIQVVSGGCTGCLLATFGVNSGGAALQPGDLVTVQGAQPVENDSVPMLLEIAPAKPGQTVVGVVQGWAELVTEDAPRPNEIGLRLIPREGPAEPGGYVTVIYNGPVQVKAGALDGTITPGVRLTLGADGGVRTLQTTQVNGLQIAESVPVVGIALSEPDENGLVWVLVNPQ